MTIKSLYKSEENKHCFVKFSHFRDFHCHINTRPRDLLRTLSKDKSCREFRNDCLCRFIFLLLTSLKRYNDSTLMETLLLYLTFKIEDHDTVATS